VVPLCEKRGEARRARLVGLSQSRDVERDRERKRSNVTIGTLENVAAALNVHAKDLPRDAPHLLQFS
jgi:hypothetical protein